MTGEPRVWADIDEAWLRSYLQEHKLASEFDLDEELIGSQVSWILSADKWDRLRSAWEDRKRTLDSGCDASPTPTDGGQSAGVQAPVEVTDVDLAAPGTGATESLNRVALDATELRTAPAESLRPSNETQRMYELTQKALSDWGAFKELFRDCPENAMIASWEPLATSPLELFKRAEKLIPMLDKHADGQQLQAQEAIEEVPEDEVTRAQNVITGYYVYCRKHRITPSLEHLLAFIPAMANGYSREVVREAWRREAD